MRQIFKWIAGGDSMSNLSGDKDGDRDSLTDWTLVDQEGESDAAQDDNQQEEDDTIEPDEREEEADEEEGDREDQSVQDDLASLGQKVEEVKGDADTESLASDVSYLGYEERVRRRRNEKSEATQDEETDLSLASCPSLPDNLPDIKPEAQYFHTPDREFNSRLNIVVALTLACVIGLGLGHFLGVLEFTEMDPTGWSSRSLWEENMNAAQFILKVKQENAALETEISKLQSVSLQPYKISGKEAKESRLLREELKQLITEIEEMHQTIKRIQFAKLSTDSKGEFHVVLKRNFELKVSVGKLIHLSPELDSLKASLKKLHEDKKELSIEFAQARFQEPIPQELIGVTRELEGLKQVVIEASEKQNPPPSVPYAKTYICFMSQVFSSFRGMLPEPKLDIFSMIIPKNFKITSAIEQKIRLGKAKFHAIRLSLYSKWGQLRKLSQPDVIATAGISTLNKMNRVIVNVVNKLREIGQSTLIKRGKAPLEKTVSSFSDKLRMLCDQFDLTWTTLEHEVKLSKSERDRLFNAFLADEAATEEIVDDSDGLFDSLKSQTPTEEKVEMEEPPAIETSRKQLIEKEISKERTPSKVEETREEKRIIQKPREERPEPKEHVSIKPTEPKPAEVPQRSSLKEKKVEKQEPKAKTKEPVAKDGTSKKGGAKKEKDIDRKVKKEKVSEKEKENSEKASLEKNTTPKESQSTKKASNLDQRKRTLSKEDTRFYKGQYNKYKSEVEEQEESIEERIRRIREKLHDNDDDERKDDDDDDDLDGNDELDLLQMDKSQGLKRHWQEKPEKKRFFRDHGDQKKQFIRRKGKKYPSELIDKRRDGVWFMRRGKGRGHLRRYYRNSDNKRVKRHPSHARNNWWYGRVVERETLRDVDGDVPPLPDRLDSFPKRTFDSDWPRMKFVRFTEDDSDDDDDDDDLDGDEYTDGREDFLRAQGGFRRERKWEKRKEGREWVVTQYDEVAKLQFG